ncbi:MAG: glycosyltransferase family 2 protein [Saprospiraceae bacterium]|nr:glycosyltransferase family 2 protein [Candidatus Opimibacter skivensis]MBL0007471.1 glycosyltransferase family 2 protein [Candidatus Opimibacter skivensis]
MQSLDLTVVILTYNESLHIQRAIRSAWQVAKEVIIVDSFSTDNTIELATSQNAKVFQHPFVNQAQQFQWAMDNGGITTGWTMRLDADEYLTDELIHEMEGRLSTLHQETSGIVLKRQVHFMGQWIRHGGYYPIHLLRIWRTGHAVIEQRWMDEHILLTRGTSITFKHDFVDDNLNSLTWWTAKHNDYATREAVDILSRKYSFQDSDLSTGTKGNAKQTTTKRWYKNNLYLRLPLFLRAFLYFQFRYWIKLGFLDGQRGLVWHFLQGFWYRFLVDAKILQIEWWAKKENKPVRNIIEEKYKLTRQNSKQH